MPAKVFFPKELWGDIYAPCGTDRVLPYAVSDKWTNTFSKSKLGLSGSVSTPINKCIQTRTEPVRCKDHSIQGSFRSSLYQRCHYHPSPGLFQPLPPVGVFILTHSIFAWAIRRSRFSILIFSAWLCSNAVRELWWT
jgi:hypothetical protein